jgi:ABC-2 type transport system ATP-binding protein
MIALDGIFKSFHRNAVLSDLSLTVSPGELVGLIGPNGAGKSTALRIIAGELLPDRGSVSIGGFDLQKDPLDARRQLGYVPQGSGVEPFLTGEEVLRFVADIRGVPHDPRVPQLLEEFDLTHAARRLTREYSEGMARRLAVAAAFIGQPKALVLDESLNGLDPRGARLVREHLESQRQAGAAILLTGHVLETMEKICTRITCLHKGYIAVDLDSDALARLAEEGKTLEDAYLEATEQ